MGTGKYYDCVFCKRGFTTAQALGGHMNIHKKDRPSKKASLPPRSSIKVGDKCLDLEPYQSIHIWHPHFHSAAPEKPADRQDPYLAGSSRTTALLDKLTYNAQCYKGTDQSGRNLFGGDWSSDGSLLRSEPSSHTCATKRKIETSSTEDNGLDLELRLGRDP